MRPKPIRALARGLAVLQALNRRGTATVLDLARDTGLPRPTVHRVMETLEVEGYVARGTSDDRYRPRLAVRGLSEGFKDEEWVAAVAAPALAALTGRILWPCDVATPDGTRMVIRDTTHRIAPLSIDRGMVGRRLPMLASSVGLAYLAHCGEAERTALLRLLAVSDDPADAPARDPAAVARLLGPVRRRGHAVRQGGALWPHTGSLGVPIRHAGRVIGCVNVIWMARVVSAAEGVRRLLGPLAEAAREIEARLAAGEG